MKQTLFLVLLGILFISLQTTWLALPFIRWARPDLVMVLTLYLGLSSSSVLGGILAFFFGYLMDLFSGNNFGLYTLTRPLLFYGTQLFKSHIYLESFRSRFLFVLFIGLAEGPILLMLIKVLNPGYLPNLYPLVFIPFVPQCLMAALLSPGLFSLLEKAPGWFTVHLWAERGGKG